MTTGQRLSPRAIKGDAANDGYVLRTVGGVPMWLPGGLPVGGTIGQSLVKTSNADYAVGWGDVSGGGGGTTITDRIYTKPATHTLMDEFDDESLAVAWQRVDAAGGSGRVTWTEKGDVLSFANAGGDGATELHGIVLPLSSFGGSLVAGSAFYTFATYMFTNNFTMLGLVIADGTTHGAGNQVCSIMQSQADIFTRPFTNWLTSGTAAGAGTARGSSGYLRLVYLGSDTWRTDVSVDGVSWRKGTTATKVMTATHVGLFSSSWGTSFDGVGSFRFIRRVSGIT